MQNQVGTGSYMERVISLFVNSQYMNFMKYVGYVYKCTCLSSNKSYIGITTKDIQARKKEHIYASFNENDSTYKTHFHAALRKHGVENFQWDILEQIVGYSLETGQELFRFKSVKEAAESLNLNHKSIANCAAGRHKYSGKIDNIKISWKYLE